MVNMNETGNNETSSGQGQNAMRPKGCEEGGMQTAMEEMFGEPISVYTREQAINDGVLIDVSEMAREAGITFPVAITSALWGGYITPDPRSEGEGQSINGRLWDVLNMFRFAARRGPGGDVLYFKVSFVMKRAQQRTIALKAMCGPGDNMEPVITVMLPDED